MMASDSDSQRSSDASRDEDDRAGDQRKDELEGHRSTVAETVGYSQALETIDQDSVFAPAE